MDDEIAEKEIKKTKLKSAILIFSIVIAFIICSIYWIYFDETSFLLSESPNKIFLFHEPRYDSRRLN